MKQEILYIFSRLTPAIEAVILTLGGIALLIIGLVY